MLPDDSLVTCRVMWNTGADDATGIVIKAEPQFGQADVLRDSDQHNGGAVYRLAISRLWSITDPPYAERAA